MRVVRGRPVQLHELEQSASIMDATLDVFVDLRGEPAADWDGREARSGGLELR